MSVQDEATWLVSDVSCVSFFFHVTFEFPLEQRQSMLSVSGIKKFKNFIHVTPLLKTFHLYPFSFFKWWEATCFSAIAQALGDVSSASLSNSVSHWPSLIICVRAVSCLLLLCTLFFGLIFLVYPLIPTSFSRHYFSITFSEFLPRQRCVDLFCTTTMVWI